MDQNERIEIVSFIVLTPNLFQLVQSFFGLQAHFGLPKPKKRKDDECERWLIVDDESISWRIFDILQVWIDAEFKIEPCGEFAD